MVAQVKAWGNSQGIRLSKGIAGCWQESKIMTLGPYEEFDWGDPEGRERW